MDPTTEVSRPTRPAARDEHLSLMNSVARALCDHDESEEPDYGNDEIARWVADQVIADGWHLSSQAVIDALRVEVSELRERAERAEADADRMYASVIGSLDVCDCDDCQNDLSILIAAHHEAVVARGVGVVADTPEQGAVK